MENGFWWTGILVTVLVIVAFIALRTAIKHFGIKRTCCGSGKHAAKREEKTLESVPIWEITLRIDDLCCEDCEIKLENAFNRMDGILAKASHKEKRAVLLLCKEWNKEELRKTVAKCGFTATDIQMKKL